MSAIDNLFQFFAATELHGTPLPGKPPSTNRRKRKRAIGKRGAPCSQTRSLRLAEITPHDVLATLVFIKNPVTRALVECLVLSHAATDSTRHVAATGLLLVLRKTAHKRRWEWLNERPDVLKALLNVTLQELQRSTVCKSCNGAQVELNNVGRVSECSTCKGTGYASWGLRRRWPMLKNLAQEPEMTEYAYKKHVQEAHSWLFDHLTHRLHDAWLTVRHARR